MSETTDSDERTESIGLRDIEDIGVADGESWAEAAERLRRRDDDDRWHYCVCGARYPARGPALQCCSDRFADEEIVTDGGTATATETEHYADGSFVTCPDCGGDLQYQNREVVLCTDCDAEFSHFYADNGTNELFRAPDMERVTTVYDPDDDQRDDADELVTDGGDSGRTVTRYHAGGPHPSMSYGPTGNGDGWVLAVTTSSEGRVEIVLDEEMMYELWTEVRGVPWPEPNHKSETIDRLARQVVHAVNGADEAMLRDALEALGVRDE